MKKLSNKTISVSEMRKMLGLGKTESYWLVHKNYFDTILVEGKMRIVTESFIKWYDNQDHYHIANGPKPGKELRKMYYSSKDIGELLGIGQNLVSDLVYRNHLEFYVDKHTMRVSKESFENWITTQEHYRLKKDREKDKIVKDVSISIPEMARILGITRDEVYDVVHNPRRNQYMEVVKVAGQKRILSDSFREWYIHQDKYHFDEADDYFGMTSRQISRDELFSIKEVSVITGVPASRIYRMIYAGKITAVVVDGEKKIRISDIDREPEKEDGNGNNRGKK